MEQSKHDIAALAGMDGSPVGVYVDGKFFKMGQFSQADYVDCHEWKKGEAIAGVLEAAPTNFHPTTIDIKAKAIAQIAMEPVDPIKLLLDDKCFERLAFLGAKRGGDYPVAGQWELFVLKLDRRGRQELQAAVWACSGFSVPKKDVAEAANAAANP